MYGEGFDDLLARVDGSGVGFYVTDIVGSVRQVLDDTGSVVASGDFDAFGNLVAGALLDRYGYTGREWDADLGLQFNRARMYDPTTGRWYAEDEKGFSAGDVNLYRYVGNRATTATDPSGLDKLKEEGDKVYVITQSDSWPYRNKGKILVGNIQTTSSGRKVITPIPGTGYNWTGQADFRTFEILTEKEDHRGTDLWSNERTRNSILVQLQAAANVAVKDQPSKGVLTNLVSSIHGVNTFGAGAESATAVSNQVGIPIQPGTVYIDPHAGKEFKPTVGKIAMGAIVGASVSSGTGFVGGAAGGSFLPGPGTFIGAVTGFTIGFIFGGIEGAIEACYVDDVKDVGSAVAPKAAVTGLVGGAFVPAIGKLGGWLLKKIAPWAVNFMFPKGTSVIGPRATYRQFAKDRGANFLDVTDKAWTKEKNIEFLEGVVRRGDDVVFAGKYDPARLDPTSMLAYEIKYLIDRGYRWTADFSRLIKQ
jgi:RHS repeat-associated protein